MIPVALVRRESGGVTVWTDLGQRAAGAVIAFSERSGGVSPAPYEGLNLGAHVGDEPALVDQNRARLLGALGLDDHTTSLVTAQQVHGDRVAVVGGRDAGSGAFAVSGPPPLSATDALVTGVPGVPLMLLFADCVPVALVAPGPYVAVVHAGWRGALAGVVGKTVCALTDAAGCSADQLSAYVGAHIGACHYQVGAEIMSHFVNTFGTVARAESGGLDLGHVVAVSLIKAGVDPCNIASLGICTAETTDRFFSYRAEAGLTGRHCALACVLSPS